MRFRRSANVILLANLIIYNPDPTRPPKSNKGGAPPLWNSPPFSPQLLSKDFAQIVDLPIKIIADQPIFFIRQRKLSILIRPLFKYFIFRIIFKETSSSPVPRCPSSVEEVQRVRMRFFLPPSSNRQVLIFFLFIHFSFFFLPPLSTGQIKFFFVNFSFSFCCHLLPDKFYFFLSFSGRRLIIFHITMVSKH